MDSASIPLNRLYHDLAYLWPLVSPPEEYAEEAKIWKLILKEKLGQGRHKILELGVGGGCNLSHLTDDFEAAAVDISENMLAHSMLLNPHVEHILADMRTVRLARTFAAVLIHDAVNSMLTQDDLAAAFATAAAHLEPGGVLITMPEHYRETFISPQVEYATHARGNTRLTYVQYAHDPDPEDTCIENILIYFIQEKDELRIEHDRHLTGLFPRGTWLRLIESAGFDCEPLPCRISGRQYEMLVGTLRRPA